MNTVTRFENRKTEVFNCFDMLKNHFLTHNPVIITDDTGDYSQAKVYADTHEFVWLVKKDVELVSYFPYWYSIKRTDQNTAYEFPYVHSKSYNVKSWDMVKLVPTHGNVDTVVRKKIICGFYDIYKGKSEFDIFYLGSTSSEMYTYLIERHAQVYCVESVHDAFKIAETEMFWIVPDGIKIADDFKFDTIPNEKAYEYPHVFGNGDIDTFENGIVLMPKTYVPTDRELEYNFYAKKRAIKQIASYPA